MPKYEDLLGQLRDAGQDDLADEFDQFSASSLRKKAEERDAAVAKAEAAERELATLRAAPKREKALQEAGIDLGQLRPAERQLISSYNFESEEPTEKEIEALIKEYQLPVHVVDEGAGTQSGAAGMVAAAQGAPAGGSTTGIQVVSKETTTDWTTETWARFIKQAPPEVVEAVKRGEAVQLTQPFTA